MLRKNLAKGRGWTLDVPFDLTDLDGVGEGGLKYFYDQQWKPYFQTIPARQRLTVDGRPVVFNWISATPGMRTRISFTHSSMRCARPLGATSASTRS